MTATTRRVPCTAPRAILHLATLRQPSPTTPDAAHRALAPAERQLVAEEEALLAAVQAALAARRTRRDDGAELEGRLRELREEALELTAKDLPTVFQEMGLVRADQPKACPSGCAKRLQL